MRSPFLLLAPLLLAAAAAAQENVLLIIGDDLGVERVGAYGEHPDPGRTPNIDRLASHGVLFRNAWSTPYCSPTRATILTGRHGFRTGVGSVIQPADSYALRASEVTLPELLCAGTGGAYRSVVLGKWHLAGNGSGAPSHPLSSGFDAHAGSLFNLPNYEQWSKNINGTVFTSTTYATTDTTDDAVRAVNGLPEPWFLWVAYNAPHKPHHAPPAALHSYDLSGNPDDTAPEHVKAMVEAMDTEIGRLLAHLDADLRSRTTIVFVGDNGTYAPATDGPFPPGHSKGTVYEGGVNVPLIVVGPRVRTPGSESAALVHTADLFATVAELAGVDPARVLPAGRVLDSVSLVPYLVDPTRPSIRGAVYTESFTPNGFGPRISQARAMRGPRYKLILSEVTSPTGTEESEELYDLALDPLESRDLLLGTLSAEQAEAYRRLSLKIESL